MSRSLVFLRDAVCSDATRLAELWVDVVRRGDLADRTADLERIVEESSADPHQRLVVAEYDGQLAGGVHLRLTTVTPLNLDLSVQVMSPHVFPGVPPPRGRPRADGRRRDLGREHGAAHIATAAAASSRDANRFMARLGLAPMATLRLAPTTAVRASY